MFTLTAILQAKRTNSYSNLLLALLWGLFVYAHSQWFLKVHEWSVLLICFSETLVVFFLIFRKPPITISSQFFDWFIAAVGSFMPLLLRPTDWGILPDAKIIMLLGTIFQLMSMLSLNRSFALVAAKREIKTQKMYRLVRHPLYASYLLIFTGYLLCNTSLMNSLIYLASIGFMGLRISREEQHLALDKRYCAYMQTVRYRLIPFVF